MKSMALLFKGYLVVIQESSFREVNLETPYISGVTLIRR